MMLDAARDPIIWWIADDFIALETTPEGESRMRAFNSELFMTTSEVAELLGVHPSTVKRWTDAGELPSEKTDGGHRRIYLQAVLTFSRERDVETYLDAFSPFESHVWLAVRDAVRHDDFRRVVSLTMGWLVRGYPRRITALFHHLSTRPDLRFSRICDGAIQSFMQEVGTSWREGRLRIGEEHMASLAVMEALLRRSTELEVVPAPTAEADDEARPVAVVGAMAGDQHHLGAMCIRVFLEGRGWQVHYLGADTPAEEFAALQRARHANLVCVSFSPPASAAHMRRCLDVLGEFYRSALPYDLVYGGQGSPVIEAEAFAGPFRAFEILSSVEGLEAWLDERDSVRLRPPMRESA
jgi:MerR family transcriptional regulator, light-induced transcriptional regulator